MRNRRARMRNRRVSRERERRTRCLSSLSERDSDGSGGEGSGIHGARDLEANIHDCPLPQAARVEPFGGITNYRGSRIHRPLGESRKATHPTGISATSATVGSISTISYR